MSPAKANLIQKVGYYGAQNGLYVQLNNSTLSFVERSLVTGSVTESVVNQSDWNVDKMNGNYRDLEKLAIRWHNRRMLGFEEDRIIDNIIREYKEVGFGAEPEQDGAIFQIPQPNGKSVIWETIEADFKKYVKEWAIKEYGSASNEASILGISARTLDRWK
jgi:hypothetical protein